MPENRLEPLFHTLTVGSLFSGIGGIDLGLERAGMRVVWQCEIDPYACKVLAKHWPDVPNLGDITTIDWTTVEPPDLICGGYPCQPFSLLGERRGESDPRHLWPYMADAVRHLGPRWAVLENVPGHLSMGFGSVLGDLADLGYDTQWDCVPAAAVGAPHLRYRVFVVAHTDSRRRDRVTADVGDGRTVPGEGRIVRRSGRGEGRVPDAGFGRPFQRPRLQLPQDRDPQWDVHHWSVEPDVGRVADGVPARVDRLRCLGNAVVPQVAELIGRWIMDVANHE